MSNNSITANDANNVINNLRRYRIRIDNKDGTYTLTDKADDVIPNRS
jgi:hypothetical protein